MIKLYGVNVRIFCQHCEEELPLSPPPFFNGLHNYRTISEDFGAHMMNSARTLWCAHVCEGPCTTGRRAWLKNWRKEHAAQATPNL